MMRRFPVARHGQFQGQILLERALFCVGCEIIFTGTQRCPRCGSDETVWPLSEWLRSLRPSTPAARSQFSVEESVLPHQHQKRPAA